MGVLSNWLARRPVKPFLRTWGFESLCSYMGYNWKVVQDLLDWDDESMEKLKKQYEIEKEALVSGEENTS